MPIITGKGVRPGLGTKAYDTLKREIAQAVADTSRLDITMDEVLVFLQPDLGTVGDGLVFEVSGIFERSDRSPAVFDLLRENICAVLCAFAKKWMPECVTVEAEIAWTMKPVELTLYQRPSTSEGDSAARDFVPVKFTD